MWWVRDQYGREKSTPHRVNDFDALTPDFQLLNKSSESVAQGAKLDAHAASCVPDQLRGGFSRPPDDAFGGEDRTIHIETDDEVCPRGQNVVRSDSHTAERNVHGVSPAVQIVNPIQHREAHAFPWMFPSGQATHP
jgi:hypothetical protein